MLHLLVAFVLTGSELLKAGPVVTGHSESEDGETGNIYVREQNPEENTSRVAISHCKYDVCEHTYYLSLIYFKTVLPGESISTNSFGSWSQKLGPLEKMAAKSGKSLLFSQGAPFFKNWWNFGKSGKNFVTKALMKVLVQKVLKCSVGHRYIKM